MIFGINILKKIWLFGVVPMLWAGCCFAQQYTLLTEPLVPVHYKENGEIKGIATEIVQAIFEEAGIDFCLEIYPWKRAYKKTLKEKNTFIYTINRTEKRERHFHWVGPILSKKTSLYKLKSRKDIELQSLSDAEKYTTAVLLGYALTDKLQESGLQEGKELVTVGDKATQIRVLFKKRVDLITGNQYTISQALKREGYSIDDVEPALHITSKGYYLGANKNIEDNIIDQLQQANEKIQHSGLVDQIVDKYMY